MRDEPELCALVSEITRAALTAAVDELATLSETSKSGVESGGGDVVTSADLAASARAGALAGSLLPEFAYLDEETAADADAAAAFVSSNRLAALCDPVDGSLAITKAARRVRLFGPDVTPADRVDHFSSTLVLFNDGVPIISAVAVARGHVFASDGSRVLHACFGTDPSLRELPVAPPAMKKRVALLGAIEHLPLETIAEVRQQYHCLRLGHFAADFVELLVGNAHAFFSGREKIWDCAVAFPFVSAVDGLSMTDLEGRSIPLPWPAWTSVRIAWDDVR